MSMCIYSAVSCCLKDHTWQLVALSSNPITPTYPLEASLFSSELETITIHMDCCEN